VAIVKAEAEGWGGSCGHFSGKQDAYHTSKV
jgi:hypothetical protein